jgi:hypothetical protein
VLRHRRDEAAILLNPDDKTARLLAANALDNDDDE